MGEHLNLRPHALVKRKGVVVVGEQTDPYVCLRRQGDGSSEEVFIQRGRFFWPGGEEIEPGNVPDWVEGMCANLTPETRAEVGLGEVAKKK